MQETTNIDYKTLYEGALGTITELKFRIDQLEKMIFGSKHERFVPTNLPTAQLALELKAEEVATCSIIDSRKISYTKTTVTVEKNPDKHGRSKLPPHLRREEIYMDPPNLPEGSIKIGQEVTEQLECTRGEIYVKKYIRFRYLVPGQPQDEKTKIVIAELPAQPVDKCMAGPSMLATILIDKFLYHLPAYRQMQRFQYSDVPIAYSTLIAWIGLACNLLEVLFEALKQEILKCGYLHADETGIKVLDQSKTGKKIHNGFFWVYNNSIDKLVFFDYQPTRSKEAPQGILANFKGFLQTDGYDGYDNFDKSDHIIHLHCMAHCRRYFFDSLPTDKERSEYVLEHIGQLYAIERSCKEKNLSFDERKEIRQEKSVPILKKLGEWMTEQYALVLPKSPIGKALAYSIKRWDKLCRYTTDGKLSIDNNLVENCLRPVALGRKNFLFCGSQNAAPRAAMMYSLIGTCKLQGIDPFIWLTDVLTRLPNHHINKIKELLPHNWKETASSKFK
jgi:transposase